MENTSHENIFMAVVKVSVSWAAVIGAMTLQQWGALVGILAGLLAAGYTALQIYVLWRDKVVNYRANHRTRSTDFGELGEGGQPPADG